MTGPQLGIALIAVAIYIATTVDWKKYWPRASEDPTKK